MYRYKYTVEVSVIAVGYRGEEPPERPKRKELEVVAKFI